MSPPLRIAMLTHSVNPRGGVVHAMNLCEALAALGVEATLHAPDPAGAGFFRAPRCPNIAFPVARPPRAVPDMVGRRIDDYVAWFRRPENRGFDLYHAHDGLSGAALATLKEEGVISAFVRTVHHIDDFADPRLSQWQARSIREADALMVVSETWREKLLAVFFRAATVVGNGVDTTNFSPRRDGSERALRERFALGEGPVFLSVGGIEARKNTINILAAFAEVLRDRPEAQLVIAGGATLLDHSAYQGDFRETLAAMGPSADRVVSTGPLADDEMPALYRLADALVYASVKEGFGLCALEAMASATPVVVSRIRPFVDYLTPDDALWCDPHEPQSIARAMRAALDPNIRERVRTRGLKVAERFSWRAVAERSLPVYRRLTEPAYA